MLQTGEVIPEGAEGRGDSDPAESGGFRAFDPQGQERHWAAPLLTSAVLYATLIAALVLLGRVATEVAQEKQVEVTFVEKVMIEEPPPPPPPQPEAAQVAKSEPAAAMAPVVRPDQKVRKLDKPPPRKELVAPKEVPKEAPKEADPSADKGVAVFGEPGQGDPAGLEGGVARGGAIGGEVGGIIDLPEGATPPVPYANNEKPEYPERMRRSGRAGSTRTVLLRLSILADGTVAKVEVVEGDEPFISAAMKTVKKWRFKPARFKGQAISVLKTYRVKFTLEA